MTIWEFSELTTGQSAFVARVQAIAPALFSVPLATNLVITGLIVWRIKQAQDTTKFTSNHKLYVFYRRLIRNTIESCILYPIALMITLVLYGLKNNGQDIVGLFPKIIRLVDLFIFFPLAAYWLNDPNHIHRSDADVAPTPLRSQRAREQRRRDPPPHGKDHRV